MAMKMPQKLKPKSPRGRSPLNLSPPASRETFTTVKRKQQNVQQGFPMPLSRQNPSSVTPNKKWMQSTRFSKPESAAGQSTRFLPPTKSRDLAIKQSSETSEDFDLEASRPPIPTKSYEKLSPRSSSPRDVVSPPKQFEKKNDLAVVDFVSVEPDLTNHHISVAVAPNGLSDQYFLNNNPVQCCFLGQDNESGFGESVGFN